MNIKEAKLLNYGSLVAINEERTIVPHSLVGYFLHSDDIQFIGCLDTLKGKIGLSFGIEYYLEGFDSTKKKDDVHFFSKIKHPKLSNPKTGNHATETLENKYNYLNQKNYDYFTFEFEWEVVPGVWTFQIIEDNRILLEKSFNIV
jgi:hypothetical protein